MEQDQLRVLSRQLTPNDVAAEILALSVVEHSYTADLVIRVKIGAKGASISDNGRGMRLYPDPGDTISHAEHALTGFYPCLPADSDTEAVLRELIWDTHGALGPALANFACPSLTFTSQRDNETWSQSYRFGKPLTSPSRRGLSTTTGTIIKFETKGRIDRAVFVDLIDTLNVRISGLPIILLAA
ncbi:MAG: hypothetical protein AAGD43_22845 [Pseudomonadota bacterium]